MAKYIKYDELSSSEEQSELDKFIGPRDNIPLPGFGAADPREDFAKWLWWYGSMILVHREELKAVLRKRPNYKLSEI